MKQLIENGLFGSNLFTVNTPVLANRYRECQRRLLIPETRLETFQIDKMGWSPQIAEELDKDDYLCHGFANPVAIILTIEQQKCSVHFPFHTFDVELLESIYETQREAIIDITTKTGICVDVENGMLDYGSPTDLLLFRHFQITCSTPNELLKLTAKQKSLITKFLSKEEAWMDDTIIEDLITSAKEIGDIRRRKFQLTTMPFNVSSFYTRAFGGVFVLREPLQTQKQTGNDARKREVLVVKESGLTQLAEEEVEILSLASSNLISRLLALGFLELEESYLKDNIDMIDEKLIDILAHFSTTKLPELDFSSMDSIGLKKFVIKHKNRIPHIYYELQKIRNRLHAKSRLPKLSKPAKAMLVYPSTHLDEVCKRTLHHLLTEINPIDILGMYRYNKSKFYSEYLKFNPTQKLWANHMILKRYKLK